MKELSLFKYSKACNQILIYQLLSKLCLLCIIKFLLIINDGIVDCTGISAMANADMKDIILSLPVLFILLLSFFIFTLYVIFDINTMLLISDSYIHFQHKKLIEIIKESGHRVKGIFCRKGILLFLFIMVLSPYYIGFYNKSLIEGFYLPDFVNAILGKMPYLYIPYIPILLLLGSIGFIYSFTFIHFSLNMEDISTALRSSKLEIKNEWKMYLKSYLNLLIHYGILMFVLILLFGIFPYGILHFIQLQSNILEFLLTFIYFIDVCIILLVKALFPVFFCMDVVRLQNQEEYSSCSVTYTKIGLITCCISLILSVIVQCTNSFEFVFPVQSKTKIIAHKAGGRYANENTLEGLEASIQHGVYGAEMDVQRTKDGYYIIHHDDTFERLCGLNSTSLDLTFEECKELTVLDSYHTKASKLSTMEEMLDAAKGKIHLFIELKGITADDQMAEDLYQMVIERNMIEDVTFISLNYDVMSTLETNHPDADTGFLCYVALGNIENINCDKLMLENAMATDQVISKIHAANKEAYIWTVDTYIILEQRLLDDCDGIITNEVDRAIEISSQIDSTNKIYRVLIELSKW